MLENIDIKILKYIKDNPNIKEINISLKFPESKYYTESRINYLRKYNFIDNNVEKTKISSGAVCEKILDTIFITTKGKIELQNYSKKKNKKNFECILWKRPCPINRWNYIDIISRKNI